ncbi:kinase-like protein [Coniophora puteana RWD-64-598 SS2]|uniref:Kinase-like protein n=1 Tax=Coniophora puteana (strain RWD-64-598) TaxID=741705 RepID=A0A5M3MDK9_CONPW|nr:kinase-like protein [Coniophora puteana RWD-64-598 SS2]EIW77213.1 kinase-like protein [Coniophora puteana RWD-64-598 SS2]
MSTPPWSAPSLPEVAFIAPRVPPLRRKPSFWSHVATKRNSKNDPLPDLTSDITGLKGHPVANGGYGDIFKAVLRIKGATSVLQVAVKAVRRPLPVGNDAEVRLRKGRKRIGRELRVWKKLRHENILPLCGLVYDQANFGPFPAMVCPWASGGNLNNYIESSRGLRLSMADKFDILNDVTSGLQYLHSHAIVHGDLTSPNILMDSAGRACLADFGMSTILAEFGNSYFSSVRQGAIRWTAPELLIEPEDGTLLMPTTQADVYSFGSIMFQVLSGNIPYHHIKNELVVLTEVVKNRRPQRCSAISDIYWDFLQICWSTQNRGTGRPTINEVCRFISSQIDIHAVPTIIVIPIPILGAKSLRVSQRKPLRRQVSYQNGAVHRSLASAVDFIFRDRRLTQIALDIVCHDLCSCLNRLANEILTKVSDYNFPEMKKLYTRLGEDINLIGEAIALLKQDIHHPGLAPYVSKLHHILQTALRDEGSLDPLPDTVRRLLLGLANALQAEWSSITMLQPEIIWPVYQLCYDSYVKKIRTIADSLDIPRQEAATRTSPGRPLLTQSDARSPSGWSIINRLGKLKLSPKTGRNE